MLPGQAGDQALAVELARLYRLGERLIPQHTYEVPGCGVLQCPHANEGLVRQKLIIRLASAANALMHVCIHWVEACSAPTMESGCWVPTPHTTYYIPHVCRDSLSPEVLLGLSLGNTYPKPNHASS